MSTLHEFSFFCVMVIHASASSNQKEENYYTFESAWRHKSDDIYTKTFVSLLCQSTYFCAILDIHEKTRKMTLNVWRFGHMNDGEVNLV